MMRLQWIVCFLSLIGCIGCVHAAGHDAVLVNTATAADESIDGDMMHRYLLRHVRRQSESWEKRYDQLDTPARIAAYQKELRGMFLDALGGLPERTPLNPQITGILQRDGYRAEKVIFQSQPGFYVTSVVFVPDADRFEPPYPAVLICCGHDDAAKQYDEYQKMAALLALNGIVAMVFDPIDQGERAQSLEHWPEVHGVYGHTMVGLGSILLGQNVAGIFIWDAMRSVDYLQSRRDVVPDRIGVTGHSGGGAQTAYLMALDDRIKAAAPSCYITRFNRLLPSIGPQDAEQNIFGQLAFGMDHADYLMMRAPMPVLICAATRDFFDIRGTWDSFRYGKRLFTRLGFAERIDLIEHDAEHSYERPHRQAVARWMSRWLLDRDEPVTEPSIRLLSKEEMQCTPDGQVMLMEGARSAYDLNRETEKRFRTQREKLWATADKAALLDKVRHIAGIRKLSDLPVPKVQVLDTIGRDGHSLRKLILESEEGVYLPAMLFIPNNRKAGGVVLYLHEKGKDTDVDGAINEWVDARRVVLAVDVRGIGRTQQTRPSWAMYHFGVEGPDVLLAYLLGKSYVGMRAEDILVCARWLYDSGMAGQKDAISLITIGHVGVPALHAAALEPELFDAVKLTDTLISWSNVIELGQSRNQMVNMIHGVLTTYDLDNLASILGSKLIVSQPRDALGRPLVEAVE